ncbi:VCBS repeat-containing protein, partial [Oleiphilus sp. HI0061]
CQQAGIADLQACRALLSLDQAVKSGQVGTCQYLAESKRKQDCLQAQLIQLARQSRQDDICSLMTQENKVAESLCRAASKVIPPKQAINYSLYPKGVQRNVLSMSSMGGWQELAEDWAVSESYWSWHSKIADLNNDGWNDIYVGNGYMFGGAGRRTQTNVLYMNKHGEGMYRAEAEMGLEDYLNTPSFVTVDFDRDGDLDIISQRVAADHGVFINQTREPGILIDLRLNGQTVLGSSVQLLGHSLEDESAAQLSQQVLGGGFLSFDEPLAHFGMAEKQS